MKKVTLIVSMITLCVGFSSTVSAQATDNATASATIVTPISITKSVEMNFGNLAVTTTAGTVVLSASSAPSRTVTGGGGGVTLPTTVGTVTAAKFIVSGQGEYTYAITLPTGNFTLTKSGGTATMIVNTFTSLPSSTGSLTLAGNQDLYVGATLAVSANQTAGLYATASTGFPVTVNYN